MKILKLFIVLTIILVTRGGLIAQQETSFQYVSPLPDSKLLSRESNIILKHSNFIERSSLYNNDLLQVVGSQSGIHPGELILSDDGKTIVFNPYEPFAPNEKVTVILNEGIRTLSKKNVEPFNFSFTITPLEEPIWLDPIERLEVGITLNDFTSLESQPNKTQIDTLPPDFPTITLGTINNPAEGNIFLTNFTIGPTDTIGHFITIADNSGNVVSYKRIEPLPAFDFKVLPNGLLCYAAVDMFFGGYGFGQYKILDTSLAVIDSFLCGNGYSSDLHDFQLLPNGHALMFAYDPQPYDMSMLVQGGDPNAIVIGGIIQELDENKNVVFQWRSWDYIPITDSYADLTSSRIDYIHLNAIELDSDGDILFIGRNLSEVTKISRQTGEIIWRLGGKQNEFSFIGEDPSHEPHYFARPHDIRRIDNGNITLFDNGDWHDPPHSRGVEYDLDEISKTATLVWEYRHDPDIYSFAMGSVQRLPNGNSLIGWGSASVGGDVIFTEVHSDNTVALEFYFPLQEASYRTFKFPWVSGLPAASVTITEVLEGNTYTFNSPTDTTGIKIKFNQLTTILYNAVEVERFEYAAPNPEFNGRAPRNYTTHSNIIPSGISSLNVDIWFDLDYYPQVTEPESTVVYHRPNIGSGIFNAVPTTYLAGTNELYISGLIDVGEFIFGYPDIPVVLTIPDLVSPTNNSLVNQNFPLDLEWSPHGFTNHQFHLQVSTEANFNTTVVDDSTLTALTFTLTPLMQNQQYYWRVKSKNLAGWSGWSDAWSFTSTAPFIDLVFPDGGEVWKTDTSMAIQWDHNLMDSVKIELYKNSTFHSIIIDSMFSVTGGYKWWALDSLPDGSDYKVKVSTLDGSFVDMSSGNFTIIYVPVGIQEIEEIATDFRLEQNYPNPFNPVTTIRYSIPLLSHVQINIYNSIGEKVADLVNKQQGRGFYEVNWNAGNAASGIYFYSIDALPSDGTEYFHSVKKMILLK